MSIIRPCEAADHPAMLAIINDAARRYCGVIPADCCHDPYMEAAELERETAAGVNFLGYVVNGMLVGVMGALLLQALCSRTTGRMLVGTWAAAIRAIRFYQRNGFTLHGREEGTDLLSRYWSVPEPQVEASVVLGRRDNTNIDLR